MYPADHPPPHFHALYGEHEALIALPDLRVLRGYLPPRALGLVMEWAALHQQNLIACWERCARYEAPGKIQPLQ
jgi:hypothetical protein